MNRKAPMLAALCAALAVTADAGDATVEKIIADLDTEYQVAVEKNDWQTMDRILHDDFTLVIGSGRVLSRAELIESARSPLRTYEKQVEMEGTQKVRVFGKDTAVITALLWLKGRDVKTGAGFDYKLWFSDTYVRTAKGWKYAFGQASRPLD